VDHILNPTIFDFFVTYSLLLSACLLFEKYIRHTLTYNRGVFLSLFVGYIMITALLTVQPMGAAEQSVVKPDSILLNLQPFQTIGLQIQSTQGHWLLMWRICLPVPFMFFVGFMTRGRFALPGLIMIGMSASFAVELALFLMNGIPQFPKHLFDVDALILNGIGVFFGTLFFRWMETKQWMKDYISETMSTR